LHLQKPTEVNRGKGGGWKGDRDSLVRDIKDKQRRGNTKGQNRKRKYWPHTPVCAKNHLPEGRTTQGGKIVAGRFKKGN